MTNVIRIVKAVVLLAVAAFIIMVIWGVFTALDSVGHVQQAEVAVEKDASDYANVHAGLVEGGDGAGEAPASEPANADEATTLAPSNSDAGSSQPQSSPSDPAPASEQPSSGQGGGSAPAPATPAPAAPAPSDPAAVSTLQKTYHPAWDEYVEEGHWETIEVPAVTGQREVYGSLCNECGADISGQATAHLKATHHSGYHEGVIGYETYEISPATSERVWVDTSHWVHHPEYWD